MNKAGRLVVHWHRLLLWAVAIYVGAGAVVSGLHYVALWQQERSLTQQIATVHAQNRVLSQDIQEMRNPAELRLILTGRRPVPSPLWVRP